MKKGVLIVVLLAMLLVPMISAEMFIGQPKSTYNIGDDFNFNVTIITSSDMNDFFSAKIVCSGDSSSGEVEIYRTPLSLKGGSQKIVELVGKFENFLAGNLGGSCQVVANYNRFDASTSNFEITRGVYVNVWTDKVILNPNDRINVSGKGIKTNGQLVTKGFVEIRIPDLDMTTFRAVESGQFNIILSIPNDAKAGSHDISARVYEKDSDGTITNEGISNTTIKINQVIRKSDIAVNLQTIQPGNDFIYTALLYDQSDEYIVDNVEVSLYKPSGILYLSKLVVSGEANNLTIPGNLTPGTWKIVSIARGVQSNRSFYISEYENIDYRLAEGTLTVTNTGNVKYDKPVEILIGSASEIEEITLAIGETKKYALSAPDGEYSVGIKTSQGEQSLGTSMLTGRTIGVDSADGGGLFGKSYFLIWFVLIAIGALVAIQQYGRIANSSYYGQTPTSYPAPIRLTRNNNNNDVISEGKREECTVISLKIKNSEDIEKNNGDARSSLDRAMTRARDARAKIYSDRDYRTIILAPSLTNEKDNSMKAVSIAREIENVLTEHNKRFGEKVMFGLGVHNGEMIIESSGKDFKFNSIGNTMPYVKKIADVSSYSTGVSETVHRRILGKVKSDKIEGTNYWRIGKIRNNGMHSEFIGKFMERQRRDANRK